MTIDRIPWGAVDGQAVDLYTLTNVNGLVARIATYGATLVDMVVPDRDGRLDDIVLGHEALGPYLEAPRYFGATVGRVGNRIAGAAFELDGRTFELAANQAPNHLHGGTRGWDKVVWRAEAADTPDGACLRLRHTSPDGDEGYPGTVDATTTYTLRDENELVIEMTATTDEPTIVNMVHHTYFNLDPAPDSDVADHVLQLFAASWTPGMPPDGHVESVAGTPFDFRSPKPIGHDLQAAGSPGGGGAPGYDGNWVVDGAPNDLRPVARLSHPGSGRVVTLRANQPGVQFYSGVFLDGATSGKGRRHALYGGLCLETQAFPNAINVPAWRDQVILRPGATYRHEMVFGFETE